MDRIQNPSTASVETLANMHYNNREQLSPQFVRPLFKWQEPLTQALKTIQVAPIYTGSGDSQIIIPVHIVDSSRARLCDNHIAVSSTWTIDLAATGISGTTGGMVDGIANTANTDYFVWAFFNMSNVPASQFIGFGVTQRPVATWTAKVNGNKGTSCTLTVAGTGANDGRRFTNGARVRVHTDIAAASAANYGTITSVASGSIIVTMDNNAGYGANLGAAVANSRIIQMDKFEPKITGADSLYPGSGTQYSFTYMGHLQTDNSSNIRHARYRGDPYWFLNNYAQTGYFLVQTTAGIAAVTNTQKSLTTWVPPWATHVWNWSDYTRTSGAGANSVYVGMSADTPFVMMGSDTGAASTYRTSGGWIPTRRYDQSIYIQENVAAANQITADHYIIGYLGEIEF